MGWFTSRYKEEISMSEDRGDRGERGGRRPRGRKPRRKVCSFCVDKIEFIDYKDVNRLRRFTNERGKILPRRMSGNCAKHQRQLSESIKRARAIALLPYTLD
jgi:small subunit ribosomal protein S18